MVEHTKGPWIARRWWEQAEMDLRLADEDEREAWLSAPYMDIYAPSARVTVTACHDLSIMSPMDAVLLAAAPELLAALEGLVEYMDAYIGEDELGDNRRIVARAAIARAKGDAA